MELTLITIFIGIMALAEVTCAIVALKNKTVAKNVANMQESLLNYQKANTMLTEQLHQERTTYLNERTTYENNRQLLTTEIALLKQELQRAKDEGFKVRPEMETEVEVEL